MKKSIGLVFASAIALGALSVQSATHYWKGGSGSWHDAANHWSPGSVPVLGEACFFQSHDQKAPAEVTFDGVDAASDYINVAEYPASVTENDGTFTNTVYLRGGGATLTMSSGGKFQAGYRRKLVIDNLKQRCDAPSNSHPYNTVQGKMSFINKSEIAPTNEPYVQPGYAGSRLLLDDSVIKAYCVSPVSPSGGSGKFIIRHGSYISWERSWASQAEWAALDIDFIDGTVVTAPTFALRNTGLLPKRPGGTLIARNTTGTEFTTTNDVVVRLGGTAYFTNSWSSTFSFTNAVNLYGRGKLFCGRVITPDGLTNRYDLSEISASTKIPTDGGKGRRMEYFGDTLFTPCGTESVDYYLNAVSCFYGGTKTIDMLEKFGRADKKRGLIIERFLANCRNKMVIRNAKTAAITFGICDDTHGGIELGEDVPATFSKDYYYLKYPFEDLKMAAGSSITTGDSQYNAIIAYGDVSFDPTATINRPVGARGEGQEPYALLMTLDSEATAPNFYFATPSTGWTVHRVGGSYFYGDGKYKPASESNNEWTGDEDGLWSNAANWGNDKLPNNATTKFVGFNNTIVTVDLDNVKCFRLWNASDVGGALGPFIIKGKEVSVTATDNQIAARGVYPFILENDIVGTTSGDFEVSGKGDNINPTPVVLRGTVTVANGSFSPDGQVVVDGTVNAKDLHFRNWTGRTYTDTSRDIYHAGGEYPTKLRVGKTGLVSIANQTTVNSATGTFFIAKGGRVEITGNWNSTVAENEHAVRGTLAVSGAIGGDATQGFYGDGVVRAASLDGSEGASIKIGEGMTLATTAAGTTTMPVVMALGDATIAPEADLTLAGGVRVDAPGRTLTVSNDCDVAVSGALTGYDFDFVKDGSGRLELAEAPGLARGYTTIRGGTLAVTRPVQMGKLSAGNGAALEFVAQDGTLPTLSLEENLDLDGLVIKVSGEVPQRTWQTILTVGEDLELTGTPETAGSSLSLKIVRNVDDTMSLVTRPRMGQMIILK